MIGLAWPDDRARSIGSIDEGPPPDEIERLFDTDYARDRLARTLYEIVIDGIGCGPRDVQTSRDLGSLRTAMAVAIRETTEVALHDLARCMFTPREGPPDHWAAQFSPGDDS